MSRYSHWLIGLIFFPLSAMAAIQEASLNDFADNVSFLLAATSDYSPRGITQSDKHPALHGSAYYNDPSGLYLSSGITGIDYDYDREAHTEVDLFAGYRWSRFGLNFDASGAGYIYPGTFHGKDYSFYEARFDINKNFGFIDLTAKVKYSPNFWYETGHSFYIPISAKIPLKKGFSLIGEIAHQSVKNNIRFGLPDYSHWSGGVSYDRKKFNYSVKYMDTDLSEIECNKGCEPRIIFTVIRFF